MAPRKKKIVDAKILRYPDSAMQSAIAAVREGRFKIREAARHFGVPHSTLINKLKGRVPEVRKMGRETYFTRNEEDLLVKYITACAKRGIPIKKQTLLETVKTILDNDERVTPFKNNRPGRKWVDLFLKRHPEINEIKSEGISTARANVSSEDIKMWHQSLKHYLEIENASDILQDPSRIFNADESGFQTCPESGKVLGPVGMKNFYQVKSGKEKEQLTVMVTINAAGKIVSPMIVYPLVRISKEISTNVPVNWGIGKSSKGWMTGPLYYEYIANIFDPWLKSNNVKKTVLLLIDGHRSHMTLQVSQYCAENKIIAYALFPNSTHITQPADVSVFKCLKSGWQNTVSDFKHNTGNRQITRAGFAPLLAKVFRDKVTSEVIINGFKRCGVYPFDISAVDFSRCMDHESRKTVPVSVSTSITGVETLLLFESLMRGGRVEQFRNTNLQWEGEESAKELFYVWKKFRQHCLSDALNSRTQHIKSPTTDLTNNAVSLPSRTTTPSPSIVQMSSIVNKFSIKERFEPSTSLPSNKTPNISENYGIPIDLCLTSIMKEKSPEESDFLNRSCTPVMKVPNLPDESETPTRSCTPVSVASEKYFECHTPTISTEVKLCDSIAAETTLPDLERQYFSPSSNLVILAQKQKQVSAAFGKDIIWPSDSPLKKTKKERLPFATTSKKWQEYWSAKEKEKEEAIKKTERNKRQREEKKAKKSKPVKKKRVNRHIESDTSESDEEIRKQIYTKKKAEDIAQITKKRVIRSDTSVSDEEITKQVVVNVEINKEKDNQNQENNSKYAISKGLQPGDFVIFVYEGVYFVGKIESICEEGALIKSMHQSLKNWRWPEKEDLILYKTDDIKEKINDPLMIHKKRGIFHVPEFEKYREFI